MGGESGARDRDRSLSSGLTLRPRKPPLPKMLLSRILAGAALCDSSMLLRKKDDWNPCVGEGDGCECDGRSLVASSETSASRAATGEFDSAPTRCGAALGRSLRMRLK